MSPTYQYIFSTLFYQFQILLQRHADINRQEIQHRIFRKGIRSTQVHAEIGARRDQAKGAEEGNTAAVQKGILLNLIII